MASAMKKVNKITQIVRLKQLVQRWKHVTLKPHRPVPSSSDSDGLDSGSTGRPTTPGHLAVYAGPERRRFVIPTRFLNLPVFVDLLDRAEEEFGFQRTGGLVLPCEADFFEGVIGFLESDEQRYGGVGLDGFLKLFSDVGFPDSCKETANVGSSHGFTPLLQKTTA